MSTGALFNVWMGATSKLCNMVRPFVRHRNQSRSDNDDDEIQWIEQPEHGAIEQQVAQGAAADRSSRGK